MSLAAVRALTRHPLGGFVACLLSVAAGCGLIYGLCFVPWQPLGNALSQACTSLENLLSQIFGGVVHVLSSVLYFFLTPFRWVGRWALGSSHPGRIVLGLFMLAGATLCWTCKVANGSIRVRPSLQGRTFGVGVLGMATWIILLIYAIAYLIMGSPRLWTHDEFSDTHAQWSLRQQREVLFAQPDHTIVSQTFVNLANTDLAQRSDEGAAERHDHRLSWALSLGTNAQGEPAIHSALPNEVNQADCRDLIHSVYGFTVATINGQRVDAQHSVVDLCRYDLNNEVVLEVTASFWNGPANWAPEASPFQAAPPILTHETPDTSYLWTRPTQGVSLGALKP